MSAESQKIVDSYIGMDDQVKIYDLVNRGMVKLGFSKDQANRYGWFCQAIYKEVKDNHDFLDGLKKFATSNKLLSGAIEMKFVKTIPSFQNYRMSAGASIAAPIVDRLATLAKQNGIELNECSLCVTKVALDIAGAGTGAVGSVSGLGIPLLVLSVIATYNDGNALAKACFQ